MNLPLDLYSCLWIYVILINFFSFILVYWDKRKAKKSKWRIPESRFFMAAFLGGALGVYLGMQQFRHKTQHRKFKAGIPVLIILNIFVFYYIIRYSLSL